MHLHNKLNDRYQFRKYGSLRKCLLRRVLHRRDWPSKALWVLKWQIWTLRELLKTEQRIKEVSCWCQWLKSETRVPRDKLLQPLWLPVKLNQSLALKNSLINLVHTIVRCHWWRVKTKPLQLHQLVDRRLRRFIKNLAALWIHRCNIESKLLNWVMAKQ